MVDTTGVAVLMPTSEWTTLQQQFAAFQTTAVLLFFAIIGILYLFHKSFPFLYARFVTHKNVVGILNPNNSIDARHDFIKQDGKFWYQGRRLDFVKVYPGNFFLAGYPFDLLEIDIRELDNPKYWAACDAAKKLGYKDINALEKALLFSMMSESDPRVIEIMEKGNFNTYSEAKAKINPGNIDMYHPLVRFFFNTIPMADLIGYGSEIPPEDITGEVDDTYEARKPSNALQKKMMKVLPICAVMLIAVVGMVLLYMVFFKH